MPTQIAVRRTDGRIWEPPLTLRGVIARSAVLCALAGAALLLMYLASLSWTFLGITLAAVILAFLPFLRNPPSSKRELSSVEWPHGVGLHVPEKAVPVRGIVRVALIAVAYFCLAATSHFTYLGMEPTRWNSDFRWTLLWVTGLSILLFLGTLVSLMALLFRPKPGETGFTVFDSGLAIPDAAKLKSPPKLVTPKNTPPIPQAFYRWEDLRAITPLAKNLPLLDGVVRSTPLIRIETAAQTSEASECIIHPERHAFDPELMYALLVHLWKTPEDRALVRDPGALIAAVENARPNLPAENQAFHSP
ncbi:hypothetical protein BJ994_002969 [Arthrobacter pigmenti]|uniref:Uncharacterized protein n=1 Tax=Arthrobacter pigmenti TaxID=271432 RepID=A0A846RL07_9MICC|nr:hypothetical protein [Arthrobacter pigmenti]NJC23893.1 hypothetical protein [Arthrobacter pigmenti]